MIMNTSVATVAAAALFLFINPLLDMRQEAKAEPVEKSRQIRPPIVKAEAAASDIKESTKPTKKKQKRKLRKKRRRAALLKKWKLMTPEEKVTYRKAHPKFKVPKAKRKAAKPKAESAKPAK